MSWSLSGLTSLPGYGLGGLVVLLLYAIQAEIRFGRRARSLSAGASDRGSSLALSLAAAVPVIGFVLAMKTHWLPMPLPDLVAYSGAAAGGCGLALRLWAVLTLRERYTRTLLTHQEHAIERGGPYRWVRHPGYLGSLLVLTGVAAASGNLLVLLVSLLVTVPAYAYRIRVEDEMLMQVFGDRYAAYRREVAALIPFVW